MKLMTLVGSGLLAVVMTSPVVMADDALALDEREQARIMQQNQQRLEQRFQNRTNEGAGDQNRYEQRLRQRSGDNEGRRYRYEEQSQQRSSSGQGGGGRR